MNVIKKIKSIIKQLFKTQNGLYYLCGSETLPKAYSLEEETEKIKLLEDGDDTAKKELIEHNLRLVVYIARKFDNTGVDLDDLISVGSVGLIKAVNTYNFGKNIKLATYASRCIENEILMYIRKHSGARAEVSIDEPLNTDWDGNELLLSDILGSEEDDIAFEIEQLEERMAVRRAVAGLEDREREIIELRYGMNGKKEMTQKEVADRLGISQSYISRLEKKIIARLRSEIKAGY